MELIFAGECIGMEWGDPLIMDRLTQHLSPTNSSENTRIEKWASMTGRDGSKLNVVTLRTQLQDERKGANPEHSSPFL